MFLRIIYVALLAVINVTKSLPSSEQTFGFNGSGIPEDASWFLDQPEFQNFLQSLPSSRNGRTLLEPEPDIPECGGTFMSLNPGVNVIKLFFFHT
jgi:hypothetical protein